MLKSQGPVAKITKMEIKQISNKNAEALAWLEDALSMEILNKPKKDIEIAFNNALALDSKCLDVHAHRAATYRLEGNTKKAFSEVKKATGYSKSLLNIPKSKDKIESSLKDLKTLLSKDGASLLGIYNQLRLENNELLSKVKERRKDTEEKRELIEETFQFSMKLLINAKPKNIHDHEAQAYAVSWTDSIEATGAKFIEMANMPENRDNFRLKVAALPGANDAQKEALYKEAIRLEPSYAKGHYELGVINYNRGDYKSAEPHFRKAIDLDKDNVDAMLKMVVATGKQNKAEECIKYGEMALKADSTAAQKAFAEHGIGVAYKILKNFKEAEVHLRKAIALEPNDIMYKVSLSAALTSQGADPIKDKEALRLINEAHKLYHVQKTEGGLEKLDESNLHFIEWAFNEQRSMLLKAVNELDASEAPILAHHAEVSEVMKDKKEAMMQEMLSKMSSASSTGSDMDQLKLMASFMKEIFSEMQQVKSELHEATKYDKMIERVEQENGEVHLWYKGFVKTLEAEFLEATLLSKANAKLEVNTTNLGVSAVSALASVLPFGDVLSFTIDNLHAKFKTGAITKQAVKISNLSTNIVQFDKEVTIAAATMATDNREALEAHIGSSSLQEKAKGIFGKIGQFCKDTADNFKGKLFETPAEQVGAMDAWGILHAIFNAKTKLAGSAIFHDCLKQLSNPEFAEKEAHLLGAAFDNAILGAE